MMHAVRLLNVRLAWMLRWPKDLLFCNELNPAKQCWFAPWLCIPSCWSVLILKNSGCARVHQTQFCHSSTSTSTTTSTSTIDQGDKALLGKILLAGKQNFHRTEQNRGLKGHGNGFK